MAVQQTGDHKKPERTIAHNYHQENLKYDTISFVAQVSFNAERILKGQSRSPALLPNQDIHACYSAPDNVEGIEIFSEIVNL